jgi:hypothetical protein
LNGTDKLNGMGGKKQPKTISLFYPDLFHYKTIALPPES